MSLRIGVVVYLCVAGVVHAEKLVDSRFGFSLEVPAGFKVLPPESRTPGMIYSLALGDPTSSEGAVVLNVGALDGRFPVTQRLKPSEIPKRPGMNIELQDIQWRGHTLDVMKMTTSLPDGRKSIAYSVQVPLYPRAIDLVVGGLEGKAADCEKNFKAVVAGFRGSRVYGGNAPKVVVVPASGLMMSGAVKGEWCCYCVYWWSYRWW